MSEVIYKIAPRAEWEAAVREGVYRGSKDDARDGFIHFSRQNQLSGVLLRHFSGQDDLLLISVRADSLGAALRFEPSFSGEMYPHLYGEFATSLAIEVKPIGA
ncbi:MAG TPA: DUF952 domain-containing protein [Polyangiales bacterium]